MLTDFENYQIGQNYVFNKHKIPQDIKYNINFLRGVFETHGYISSKNILTENLHIFLKFDEYIITLISKYFTFQKDGDYLMFYNYNALDFLSKIYDNSDARFRNNDYYEKYIKYI